MVAARHLHLSNAQAQAYGLNDGDVVSLHAEGQRGAVYHNIHVRAGEGHFLEAHIDKDEANGAEISDGALCRIQKQANKMADNLLRKGAFVARGKKERQLISEDHVKAARDEGQTILIHDNDAIITPLAKDAAWEYRIELKHD